MAKQNPQIASVLPELGTYVTGLRVLYRGFGMSVYPPDETSSGWLAHGTPDAEDDSGYPLEVTGSGATPMAAMDACFQQCKAAEEV